MLKFYKIANEDYQNLDIQKILKQLKIDVKNIIPELQIKMEDDKKNPLVKEIFTDELKTSFFYKDQELFMSVQSAIPDFSNYSKCFFVFMRILVSSTLVFVNTKEDCLLQKEDQLFQQGVFIKSIKKGKEDLIIRLINK